MSTVAMAEASPRSKARMAGVFYLLVFLAGAVSLSIGGKFVVADDAVATAQNYWRTKRHSGRQSL